MAGSEKPPLRIRISPKAERAIQSGHPWVFLDNVTGTHRPSHSSELAVVYGKDNKFLAIGIFDAESPIAFRVLHWGNPVRLDENWWRQRLRTALLKRQEIFKASNTTGFRCVHGENDGWPGLVIDRYGDCYVVKIYTSFWLHRLDFFTKIFKELEMLGPVEAMLLRWSRNIGKEARQITGQENVLALNGEAPLHPVEFLENGLRFEADVCLGQKTGFFLDQRENRAILEGLSSGRDVLNCFAFSGGFSVYAARGGAATVESVDISEHALASARRNFALNMGDSNVRSCKHSTVQADVFKFLKTVRQKFGLVILDPPSLAAKQADKPGAMAAYQNLISSAILHCDRDAILMAASCSAHVEQNEFFTLARETVRRRGRKFEEVRTTGQPPDHPACFKEAHYLKCVYFRLY